MTLVFVEKKEEKKEKEKVNGKVFPSGTLGPLKFEV
jgi:hypothetical protein